LFGGRPLDSLYILQEEMELNEQFLPASSRQWLKKKSVAYSHFSVVEILRGQGN
jgi:LAS superfamily LD-carboxypeptidase LdcB